MRQVGVRQVQEICTLGAVANFYWILNPICKPAPKVSYSSQSANRLDLQIGFALLDLLDLQIGFALWELVPTNHCTNHCTVCHLRQIQ